MSACVAIGFVVLHSSRTDTAVRIESAQLPDIGVLPRPAPRPPEKTVLVRVDAPQGGCWSAFIDSQLLTDGCGSLAFPLDVQGLVVVHFEKQQPGDWQFGAAIEVDGRVVQTVGPTTDEYPSFDIGYRVPEEVP